MRTCVKDVQFVEFNDPVCRKKFYKLHHLGPVCRILQTGILQTRPNSNYANPANKFKPSYLHTFPNFSVLSQLFLAMARTRIDLA